MDSKRNIIIGGKSGVQMLQGNAKSSFNSFILIVLIASTVIFLITTIVFLALFIKEKNNNSQDSKKYDIISLNDESRYIPIYSKVTENEGAYIYQGKHDILNSKYYNFVDVFNMKSSGSLILLERFKTYQQTSEYSCGIASLIMAAYYIDGRILNETDLYIKAGTNESGTEPEKLEKVISDLGYTYESKSNFTEDTLPSRDEGNFSMYLKDSLRNKEPVIILSNDWAGHYTVIIGYDDMGNDKIEDDVIIIADPYDTTDHISDGYTIFNYERYYYQMNFHYDEINGDKYFIKIKRKKN